MTKKTTKEVLECISAKNFFKKYTKIKSYQHKMRGKNGVGNPLTFTIEEKGQIKKGIIIMCNDILKNLV